MCPPGAKAAMPLRRNRPVVRQTSPETERGRGEQEEFLPFAQRVLARQAEGIAILGLTLHRRHEAGQVMSTAVVYGAT